VRRRPELELPLGERDGCGDRGVAHLVPRVLAAQEQDLALLAADRLDPAAAGRILALRPHHGVLH
jgi:hypothetical protein